ncbi:casein kinase 2 regulatory subunit [Knufia obscura]|uniref:Casein kinase II subunit beta n=2 Tax=Knufia TaxID=430999 RepID=A0AAN8IAR5_9EURO|nr:casein kinase 2 regulatory subunit [Knufia obscura]KAK5955925.1 casein kinase 2 regulatory subunit [Knufia fluminis]
MSATSSAGVDSWISTFCSLMGHEYFAEVSEDFIEDDFNLTGLQAQVPMYKEALEMILDVEPSETGSELSEEEEEEEEQDEEEDEGLLGEELDQPAEGAAEGNGAVANRRRGRSSSDTSVIESSAELLYGLIHARYITSRPGIQQMMEKYEMAHFGYCPRVYCHGTKVLPVGRTDTPGQETVKLFCPSCLDIYTPPNSRFQAVDGAFFGTTFPGLFLMTFPDLDIAPAKKRSRDNGVTNEREETESVLSPNEAAAQQQLGAASRSSSLTLPSAPPIPGVNTQSAKDERRAAEAAALAALPPQPASINGVATQNLAPGLGRGKIYEPKIYGFRVSERAKGGPRMRWLRSKPLDINELDEARLYHEKYGGNVDGDPDEEADEEEGDEEDEEEQEHDGDQIMQSADKATSTKRKSKNARSSRGGAAVAAGGG